MGFPAKKINASSDLSFVDFQFFKKAIHEVAGISLTDNKIDLVKTRLRTHMNSLGLNSFSDYRNFMENLDANSPEWQSFINVLTTNKTDFFREMAHFDFMSEKLLPAWIKSGEKSYKVWSAACSTGEEPYSISMLLAKELPKDKDYKILGTDIDTKVVETAKNAVYSTSKLIEIPDSYLMTSIAQGKGDIKNWFKIKKHIKDKVVFKTHNLIESTSVDPNTFDLIFCRNVFIYFNRDTIEFVLKKLYHAAKPGAYLFIGHSESLQNIKTDWIYCSPAIYRKE